MFALRSTDPALLYEHADPVGPLNDATLLKAATNAERVVMAWGVHGKLRERGAKVAALLASLPIYCLGTTRDGHPKHPPYLAGNTVPIPWKGTG